METVLSENSFSASPWPIGIAYGNGAKQNNAPHSLRPYTRRWNEWSPSRKHFDFYHKLAGPLTGNRLHRRARQPVKRKERRKKTEERLHTMPLIWARHGAPLTFIQQSVESLPELAGAATVNRTYEPIKSGGRAWHRAAQSGSGSLTEGEEITWTVRPAHRKQELSQPQQHTCTHLHAHTHWGKSWMCLQWVEILWRSWCSCFWFWNIRNYSLCVFFLL